MIAFVLARVPAPLPGLRFPTTVEHSTEFVVELEVLVDLNVSPDVTERLQVEFGAFGTRVENGIRLSLIDHAKAADEPGEVHHDRAGLCDVAGPSDRGIDQHSPVYRLNNRAARWRGERCRLGQR